MKLSPRFLGAIAFVALIVSGCGDSSTGNDPNGNDPNNQNQSKRSLLVAKKWPTYAYVQDGVDQFPGPMTPNWIVFDESGSYSSVNGMLQEMIGSWELAENDSKVVLDKGRSYERTWTIDLLSNNLLVLSTIMEGLTTPTKWYLDKPLKAATVDRALFPSKKWTIELAIFDGGDVTTTAAGSTEFKSDGTYATAFTGGGSKSGTWEFGPAADEVTLDKGNSSKEKTWQIVELTSNRLDMVDGDDRTLSFINPELRTGGKNDLLTAASSWRVDSARFNGSSTTLITSAPTTLTYKSDGAYTEVRRNGQTYRSRWELANGATAITGGMRLWDIVELNATTLRIRRLYRGDRFGVLEVFATKQ